MTGPARTAAIERRLERSVTAGPSPDLRRRVLEAVDDMLAERRPAVAGGWASTHGWTWAAAVALVCAAFVVAMSMQAGDVEPISLARRLQVAGVADEAIVAGLVDARPAAAATKPDRRGPEAPTSAALRAIDGIRILEENL